MEVGPEQVRAARALLRLKQIELAKRAHVSIVTIRRLEGPQGNGAGHARHPRERPRGAGAAGVEFIPGGVRRRASQPDAHSLFEDLRAISLRSAARLQGRELLTDADLYDENGLPA